MLDGIRVRIRQHYQEIVERDNYVTAEKVKSAFLGLEHRCHTLMKVFAQHNKWLMRDPFREYELQKESTTRGFLTRKEISQLMNGKLKNAKQELYRDLYLFCIFTGLSFSDMRNLSEENLRTYLDEHLWIRINHQKTGVESNIRLRDIPTRIIEKYQGLCADGRIFPVPHYRPACTISVPSPSGAASPSISWHMSRHTMATEICLANGVQILNQYRIKNKVGRPKGKGKRTFVYEGQEYNTIQECADQHSISKQGMYKKLKKLQIIKNQEDLALLSGTRKRIG